MVILVHGFGGQLFTLRNAAEGLRCTNVYTPDAPCLPSRTAFYQGRFGIQTGVVTHGLTMKQAEKLVRLGLLPHLDPNAIFISDQIGISKPNPKLWAHALADLGREPFEVMYVGDSPTHDVAPPQSLGMIAVWARRAAKQDLGDTGIVPDHVVDTFDELRGILRDEYGLAV